MDTRLLALRSSNEKQATVTSPAMLSAMKSDAGRYIASILAASFGAGVLGRTAIGANRLMRKPLDLGPGTTFPPAARLPAPEEEEGQPKYAALQKMAKDPNMLQSIGDWIGNNVLRGPGTQQGATIDKWHSIPAFWPVAMGGGLAAGYGGYKLTDKILDMRRKAELESEFDEAKSNYEQAVQQRFKQAERVDTTDAVDLLDDLAVSGIQKQAEPGAAAPSPSPPGVLDRLHTMGSNAAGTGFGAYLTYALLAGLGSGALGYGMARKNSPRNVTDEALKERARQRHGMTPPMYISQLSKTPGTP